MKSVTTGTLASLVAVHKDYLQFILNIELCNIHQHFMFNVKYFSLNDIWFWVKRTMLQNLVTSTISNLQTRTDMQNKLLLFLIHTIITETQYYNFLNRKY